MDGNTSVPYAVHILRAIQYKPHRGTLDSMHGSGVKQTIYNLKFIHSASEKE